MLPPALACCSSAWSTEIKSVVTVSESDLLQLGREAAPRERDSISSLPGLTRQSMLAGRMKIFSVYILASRPRGTLYVAITSNLVRRIYEHREGLADGFTKEHGIKMLVYYEQHAAAISAIQREKNIKHWSRKWKLDLICSANPEWRDLWEEIVR